MEEQRSNAGVECETSDKFGVPGCSIRSGDLIDWLIDCFFGNT